jgi:hypothetical protein
MISSPLYLKHVGFVGKFASGTLPLKDIVYAAGGAPVDNISVSTHYVIVGNGGENTKLYKSWQKHIENGHLLPLTVERLMAIIAGKEQAPEPTEYKKDTSPFAEQQQQLKIDVWQDKRDKFVMKYGLPTKDGKRKLPREQA